ncbi:hypothetical protein ACFO26_02595 [Lactococcus nasutitermitis]|uniref:DUF1453 domain-containing protein n=1 Tax=Lactococcus nasutitermitis TaxID=1652957 RepID=A0ABV9JEI6_9LACT|nr:hypothetical protein [Lactococcus nasutitermitis]
MDINAIIHNNTELIIDGIVLILVLWIIFKQLRVQRLKYRPWLYVIIIVIGLNQAVQAGKNFHISANYELLVFLGSLCLPIFLGLLRAMTYHYWVGESPDKKDGGKQLVLRQGSWLTLLLWIINFALHGFIHYLNPETAIFSTFEIGLTLFAQRMIAYTIARRKFPREIENN